MNWIKDTIEYVTNLVKIWVIIQPWEAGVRVRMGKSSKTLGPGIYFRLPYIDSVYVQPIRLRVVQNPVQTITTKDNHTVTVTVVAGYSITDIQRLYKTLHAPDSTLSNITLGKVSDYVSTHNLSDITTKDIEKALISGRDNEDYGVKFEYAKVVGFANVRTYRLIQDSSWMPQDVKLDEKK